MENDFLNKFMDVLEITDREVCMSDEFKKYDEWDSLAYLSLIAMIDEEYDKQIEESEFKKLVTVEDLFKIISE